VAGVQLFVRLPRRRLVVTSAWLVPVLLTSVLVVVVAGAAAAAIESRTVSSFGEGLWWSISLITTVGFIGEPPETTLGAVLSAVLMVLGFLLLAMVSASLAALFVREEERPHDDEGEAADTAILEALVRIERRLADLERRADDVPQDGPPEPVD
jgi:voltage-gated potassium channel Kch